ncbi:hypothetical protein ACVOMV_11570 [Mesorhizobium atlanticum]
MTPDLLSSLSLSTPELILAVGALVLLMIGAYSRSNNTMTVTGLSGPRSGGGRTLAGLLRGAGRCLWRRLRAGCLRRLHEDAGADRLGGDAGHVDALWPARSISTSSNSRSWCCSARSACSS